MSGGPRACGFLIFRQNQATIEYLMLRASYGSKHWTPPKGHVDPGEDDLTTAYRETEEEAGLGRDDLKLLDKKWTNSYPVKDWRDGIVRQKTTIYYLAQLVSTSEVRLSEEHTDLSWAKCADTKNLIPNFDDLKRAIDEAEEIISNKL